MQNYENSPALWAEACKILCKGLVVFFFLSRPRARGRPRGPGRRQFAGRTNVNPAPTPRQPRAVATKSIFGLLKNCFSMKERSFVSFQPSDIQVASNKPEWDGPLVQATDWFGFAPHFGWEGAIERTSGVAARGGEKAEHRPRVACAGRVAKKPSIDHVPRTVRREHSQLFFLHRKHTRDTYTHMPRDKASPVRRRPGTTGP